MAIVIGKDGKAREYQAAAPAPRTMERPFIPNVQPGMVEQPPHLTEIMGQPHMLAYINPEEAEMLMREGGMGIEGPMGIPAFPPDSAIDADYGYGGGSDDDDDPDAGDPRDPGSGYGGNTGVTPPPPPTYPDDPPPSVSPTPPPPPNYPDDPPPSVSPSPPPPTYPDDPPPSVSPTPPTPPTYPDDPPPSVSPTPPTYPDTPPPSVSNPAPPTYPDTPPPSVSNPATPAPPGGQEGGQEDQGDQVTPGTPGTDGTLPAYKYGQDYDGKDGITYRERLRDMFDGGGAGKSGALAGLPSIGFGLGLATGIGSDLKMGLIAGFNKDKWVENLVKAGYSTADAEDYVKRTEATQKRQQEEMMRRSQDNDDGPAKPPMDPCPTGYIMDPQKGVCIIDPSAGDDDDDDDEGVNAGAVYTPPPLSPYLDVGNTGGGFTLQPGSEDVSFMRRSGQYAGGGQVGLGSMNPFMGMYKFK